jgi:hypothetical protein
MITIHCCHLVVSVSSSGFFFYSYYFFDWLVVSFSIMNYLFLACVLLGLLHADANDAVVDVEAVLV